MLPPRKTFQPWKLTGTTHPRGRRSVNTIKASMQNSNHNEEVPLMNSNLSLWWNSITERYTEKRNDFNKSQKWRWQNHRINVRYLVEKASGAINMKTWHIFKSSVSWNCSTYFWNNLGECHDNLICNLAKRLVHTKFNIFMKSVTLTLRLGLLNELFQPFAKSPLRKLCPFGAEPRCSSFDIVARNIRQDPTAESNGKCNDPKCCPSIAF